MSGGAETVEDFGAAPGGLAARWLAEIEAFDKEREPWVKRVDAIHARYRADSVRGKARGFSLLWSNVEVLKPTLYARDPNPRVFRRFRDRDPVGRVAATLLERVLACQIEKAGEFGQTMRAGLLDFLLSAQGQAWVFYEPVIVDGQAVDERVRAGHVHWRDFGMTAGARTWAEVTAVWRVEYMDRDSLIERFGDDARKVPLDRKSAEKGAQENAKDVFGKASIYEIWDSISRQVFWLYKGAAEPLDVRPYPLKIRGMFPCPRPLFGTMTTGSTVPVPDYVFYQDQAAEIDELTNRIAALGRALKLVGFAAGDAAPEIQKGLADGNEVSLVPVASWAMGQGSPMSNAIAWLPVREVAEAMARLIELRERVKSDAYEITGLSDILRGSTVASETATAQQIKAQWGSVRVRDRQGEVARWARDVIEIMADVVAGHFSPEKIVAEANVEGMAPEALQHVPAALALLKGEGTLRSYRIDVETDSTIAPDEQGERQAATELLTAVGGYLQTALPILQGVQMGAPHASGPMAEMVGQLLTMAVRRFRGAEEAEEVIERAMEALAKPPEPVAPQGEPAPDPAMMEMQAKAQMDGAKMQLEQGKAQADVQIAAEELAIKREELGLKQRELALKEAEAMARMNAEQRAASIVYDEGEAKVEEVRNRAGVDAELKALLGAVAQVQAGIAANMGGRIRVERDEAGRIVGAVKE